MGRPLNTKAGLLQPAPRKHSHIAEPEQPARHFYDPRRTAVVDFRRMAVAQYGIVGVVDARMHAAAWRGLLFSDTFPLLSPTSPRRQARRETRPKRPGSLFLSFHLVVCLLKLTWKLTLNSAEI